MKKLAGVSVAGSLWWGRLCKLLDGWEGKELQASKMLTWRGGDLHPMCSTTEPGLSTEEVLT